MTFSTANIFTKLYLFYSKVLRHFRVLLYRGCFCHHGTNFRFDPDGSYSFENISVGDNVSLGLRPLIMAAKSKVKIGNNVMLGPEVFIIAGNHNTSEIGYLMKDVTFKRPNDDIDIIIDDDVWIGARSIILRGIKVGRGSVVAAGSVVTKNVLPYSIVAGNPASLLKFRWDVNEIISHEKLLYRPEDRLSVEYLTEITKSLL